MDNALKNMEEILDHQILGFHQYVLSPPIHLNYVSKNLCDLLGMQEELLLDPEDDLYMRQVYPADQDKYAAFIQEVIKKEQPVTEEYRLKKKDGSILYVRDRITPKRQEDGILTGCSVLTDITDLKNENTNFLLLQETIPCGFLRYTCEKQPRITYISPKMIEMMRFSEGKDGEIDYLEMYKSNIFLMIPMEKRRQFSQYLQRVHLSDVPIAGDMTLLRCDGTRAHIFGWVAKTINEQGEEEFQSVCMDVTEGYQERKKKENERYLQALTDVYDKIFEIHMDANTVKCLHCNESSAFQHFKNIAVQMEDAMDQWLLSAVSMEYRDEMEQYFREYCQGKSDTAEGKPPQIIYKARSTDGSIRQYTGVFLKMDESVSLYCCRETKNVDEDHFLKLENIRLKEKMRDLVVQFSDGLAAFEISPEGGVKPLYASDNVCEFFGYTKEEWITLTERYTPIENFVAYSEASYEKFAELLRIGEAEFSYYDYRSEKQGRIKAICSEKEPTEHSSRYIMLYEMDDTREGDHRALMEKRKVSIRTFGYFDVFVGETPVAFRNKKSKELFALLVDRKGGYVTSEEAISFLWEEESVNALTLSRYRKVALRLKSTLEEYGISDVIESIDGKRRVVLDKVDCDLYQYLSGKEEYAQLFKGSYLTNYSWGETTLGELINH